MGKLFGIDMRTGSNLMTATGMTAGNWSWLRK
jgi:hypothetical protein